jgi:hypothetical protein
MEIYRKDIRFLSMVPLEELDLFLGIYQAIEATPPKDLFKVLYFYSKLLYYPG